MVELIINLIIAIVISCAVVIVSVVALLALRLYLSHKEKKFNPTSEPKVVKESSNESEEEKEKEQIDYISKVYALVDDVLSGKKELGDKEDET
jgi:flagellar basal body-associated protein FliL